MKQNITFLFVLFILKLVCSDSVPDDDEEEELRRPLQSGDVLTPRDFIEIAKRLRAKVEDPGAGKGIVSSSRSDETLADKLFQEFFITSARIIPIRDLDMAGLDALQALALSGKEFDPEIHFLGLPLSQRRYMFHVKCQYALITRRVENSEELRRAISIRKKPSKTQSPANKKVLAVSNRDMEAGDHNGTEDSIRSSHPQHDDNDDLENIEVPRANSTYKVVVHDIRRTARFSAGKPKKLLKTLRNKRVLKVSKRDMSSGDHNGTEDSSESSDEEHDGNEDSDHIYVPRVPRANHTNKVVLQDLRREANFSAAKPKKLLKTLRNKRVLKVSKRALATNGSLQLNDHFAKANAEKLQKLEERFNKINNLSNTGDGSEVNKRYSSTDREVKPSFSTAAPLAENLPDDYDDDVIIKRRKLPDDKKCIWMYRCKIMTIMESCHVYPECADGHNEVDVHDLPIYHLPDEHQLNIQEVRRILGITIVDEEVQKIFERRYILMLPRIKKEMDRQRPVGNILGYFNRLERSQKSGTTPMYKLSSDEKKRNHDEKRSNRNLTAKRTWRLDKDNHFDNKKYETDKKSYLIMDSVTHPFKK